VIHISHGIYFSVQGKKTTLSEHYAHPDGFSVNGFILILLLAGERINFLLFGKS
jgi:hypothetical protein